MHNMLHFQNELLKSARQALKEGTIERDDYRRLFLASFFPGLIRKLQDYATQLAVEEQVFTAEASTKAIDWAKFGEFIKTILPLILEFLKGIGAFK